jgi:hypothetical protein
MGNLMDYESTTYTFIKQKVNEQTCPSGWRNNQSRTGTSRSSLLLASERQLPLDDTASFAELRLKIRRRMKDMAR